MKIRELISQYCDKTEKKGNGITIYSGTATEPIETPELFAYMDFLSDEPSRKIWHSDDYRMYLTQIDGKITVYEHVRLANYRIQLLDLKEKYGEKKEMELPDLADAFAFASREHENETRKSGTPYISHPMDVASILLKENASHELVLAGWLHDLVEDTDVDIETIKRRYGEQVADYVDAVTEPEELRQAADGDKTQNWKDRKEYTVRKMTRANSEVKLLSCADKLANIRDLISDIRMEGEGFWDKFNAPKEDQEWYYRSILEAFATGPQNIKDTRAYRDLEECVEQLF
ncbi:HD domain-containing protein [Methanococcoides methylutens]|uniref:GTP pyrophosphokinase, (P)ppGpp synthetase I n=1 Tax=Methanococcoides methylutens MM1 TaxID=1434104 RepID=A0A0E3X0B9_METMT|nr:HD domain-containing protein [Methanococcoides methylutens]AKB85544.1 GTP pyrophosphokinase, (p)ppGpp synthetase I [Methanococcoides methylutens MM1]